MKLGRRPTRKKDQALDVVASAAQTWSKWHLGKRAGEGVAKGAKKAAALKSGKPSMLKRIVTGTPAKLAGGVALVGGLGAMVARKLKGGGDAEPAYTPPAPHEPAAAPPPPPNPTAAAIVHDAPPPPSLSAAPDPPAPSPPADLPKPETPVAVEDLAADRNGPGAHEEPATSDEADGSDDADGSDEAGDDDEPKD